MKDEQDEKERKEREEEEKKSKEEDDKKKTEEEDEEEEEEEVGLVNQPFKNNLNIILQNAEKQRVPLDSFHLNGHPLEFHLQT